MDESYHLKKGENSVLPNNSIRFDAPACYRIVVQGVLPEPYYPCFEDMNIMVSKNKAGIERTTLSGTVIDQAALAGILNILYDHQFPILSVQIACEDT